MLFIKISTTIILLAITRIECSGIHPVLHPAPAISYVKSVPYNVPPFAASVNIFSRLASPIPRPILHSPQLLNAAPVVPQVPYFSLPYPQARSIHPPSVVTREVYPDQVVPAPFPGAFPVPLPIPGAYPGPLPLPLSGQFPLSGPLPYPGHFPLAGSPHLPGPIPYPAPAPVPIPEPLPHPIFANPAYPALPNVNPYATPFVPPNNLLAPPLLKR